MTGIDRNILNISKAIDSRPVGKFLVQVTLLCSMVAFLNGLDSTSIGIAAPLIINSLHLTEIHLGPVFSAGLLGAVIGTPFMGSLGDRFGRKRVLIISSILFGFFTLVTAFVSSFKTLLLVRFLGGIGLGGATPCFIALASEYAPHKHRATVTSIVWAVWPVGANLGAILDGILISHYGWHSIFFVGGIFPLIVIPFLIIWLPESIRFFLVKKRNPTEIRRIVSRIVPILPTDTEIVTDDVILHGSPIGHLFSQGRAVETLLLWVLFFTAVGTGSTVFFWAPALMHDHGIPVSHAAIVLGIGGMGMLVGGANTGWLKEKFGGIKTLVPALILGGLTTALVGFIPASVPRMAVDLTLNSALIGGMGTTGALALAALRYPTSMRSTGIGWGMGVAGVGQVLSQLFVSVLLNAGWSIGSIFVALAFAPLIGAGAVVLLELRETVPD